MLFFLQKFTIADFQLFYVGALDFKKLLEKIKKITICSTDNQFDHFVVIFAALS